MATKKESKASKSPGKASLTRVSVYNPLELTNLGDGIKRAIETCALLPLEDVTEFESAGLYLLYTTGSTKSFPEYRSVEEANSHGRFEKPIYVGKAMRSATRIGLLPESKTTTAIYTRLNNHRNSIKAASSTLDIKDFYYRYLPLEEAFIALGESHLIAA